MRLLKLLFVFVAFALSLEAAWTPTCTNFVYVNGINTLQSAAQATVDTLFTPQTSHYLASKGKAGICYHFELAYNESGGITADLTESARLFLGQDTALDKFKGNNALLQTATPQEQAAFFFAATSTPISQLTETFAQTKTANTTPEVLRQLPPSEQATVVLLVDSLLTSINSIHGGSNTTVCLGHSEGNFFCNLAYRIIKEDNPSVFQAWGIAQPGLSTLGLFLPDPRVLQVVALADPTDFSADGRYQYLTVCSDVIGAVPNSLPPNYTDSATCAPTWQQRVWQVLGGQLFSGLVQLFRDSTIGVHQHLIETYLTEGTEPQNRVMRLLENSLLDPGCNGDTDCYLKETFSSTSFDNNWTQVKFPSSVSTGTGLLTLASKTAGQDPATLLFNDGGGLSTRRVFTGPFTLSLLFMHIGGGKSTASLKNASDNSIALALTTDTSPGQNSVTVYPASTASLPTASAFGGWHQISFIKKDTQVFLTIDGASKTLSTAGVMDGYYLEVYSQGDNSLQIKDLSVARTLLVVSSPVPTVGRFGLLSPVATAGTGFDGAVEGTKFDQTTGVLQVWFCQSPNNSPCYRHPAAGTVVSGDSNANRAILTGINLPSGVWRVRVRNGATGDWSNFSDTFNVAPKASSPLSLSCSATPSTINEGQLSTFKAAIAGGTTPYRFVWSGAVSGTAQNIGKTFLTAATYQAQVVVTDASSPIQSQSATCSLQVNPVAPAPTAPVISGFQPIAIPIENQPFSLDVLGTGFSPTSLQMWFFGMTSCQAGCRHPAAGVTSVTATAASLVNVRLVKDTYRMKVRNGDAGPWSAASKSFDVLAESAAIGRFTGSWVNDNASTPGITRVQFRADKQNIFVHMWGSCKPADCDWKETSTPVADASDGVLSLTWNPGFAIQTQQVAALADGRIRVNTSTHFIDNSGRQDYVMTEYFHVGGDPHPQVGFFVAVGGQNVYSGDTASVAAPASGAQAAFYGEANTYEFSAGGVAQWEWADNGTRVPSATSNSNSFNWQLNAGTHNLTLVVTDTLGLRSATATATITITLGPALSASCDILPSPVSLGQGATVYAEGSGGVQPYQYQMGVGLPFSSVNSIAVMPTTAGTYTYSGVTVKDSTGQTAATSCRVLVNTAPQPLWGVCQVNGQSLPVSLQVGNQATFVVGVSGGTPPWHFTWAGISGNDSNAASQVYVSPGTYDVSAVVLDSAAPAQRIGVPCPRVTVAPPPPISAFCNINPNPINLGSAATLTAGAIGGTSPYQFMLPGSSSYGSSNSVIVLPQQGGTAFYQVTARDSNGQTNTAGCSVQVNGVAPTITLYGWYSQPRNQVFFSGYIEGTSFVPNSSVYFCTSGTTTCWQQPTPLVTVYGLGSIGVSNVSLTTGSWQIEVRTPYGSARSNSFAVTQ